MRQWGKGMMAGMLVAACAALGLVLAAPAALAAENGPAARKEKPGQREGGAKQARGSVVIMKRKLVPRLPRGVRKDFQKYCYNIADAARDARYARQKKKLQDMQARLNELLGKLEKKRKEVREWVLQRREIRQRMTAAMLDVYAKMEPEAAAAQIAQMEYEVAVAILTGLKPQQASAILTEMDPRKAGRIVTAIVGVVAQATPRATRETN